MGAACLAAAGCSSPGGLLAPAAQAPTPRCATPRCAVILSGPGAKSVLAEGELIYLHSDHPEDENSFDSPTKVCVWVRVRGQLQRAGLVHAPLWRGGVAAVVDAVYRAGREGGGLASGAIVLFGM